MAKARYICFEGTEGVGKTTQTNLIAQTLMAQGYKVLLTKEPGTPYAPLTMVLRGIMLDKQYDTELTPTARELVSQAIRSIHLEKVIIPALDNYDFIIQDRGILSGLAYGTACGNSKAFIESLMNQLMVDTHLPAKTLYDEIHGGRCTYTTLYDDVIYLRGNIAKGLNLAQNAKQEFKAGDAIEAKGVGFLTGVAAKMDSFSKQFNGVKYIDVDDKNIEQVTRDILNALDLKGVNDANQEK